MSKSTTKEPEMTDFQNRIADQRDAYLTIIDQLLAECSTAAVRRTLAVLEDSDYVREGQTERCDFAASELRELAYSRAHKI